MYFAGTTVTNLRQTLRKRHRAYQVFEQITQAGRHGMTCDDLAACVFELDPSHASQRLLASARHNVIKTISRLNEFLRERVHNRVQIVFDRRTGRYVISADGQNPTASAI